MCILNTRQIAYLLLHSHSCCHEVVAKLKHSTQIEFNCLGVKESNTYFQLKAFLPGVSNTIVCVPTRLGIMCTGGLTQFPLTSPGNSRVSVSTSSRGSL